MLHLWNTRSRSLEPFVPLHPPKVGMYTCGPTVYGQLTLGNWRKYINDDVLDRALRFFGYDVTHVTNITDVGHLVGDGDEGDDKIAKEARKTGKTAWDIARYYEEAFLEGMKVFHIRRPEHLPRATDHIAEQIALVQELEAHGFTYRISDGIYFDTAKFSSYGSLSGQRLEEKEAGARVEVNHEKHSASDFALWKFSPEGERRHMEWPSPWGVGFPGWAIECSAMSVKYLGQPFEIHTGGIDHIPVHHENEIAQSEAVTGVPLAKYWVHNEFLLVDGGRMGKSLGNGYVIADLESHGINPLAYRWFVLGAQYRSKLNFTWEAAEAAQNALEKLKHAVLSWGEEVGTPVEALLNDFRAALEDDLNTPKALAVVWELVKSEASSADKRATLLKMDEVLGLDVASWKEEAVEIPQEIHDLAEARWQARASKNWAESDRLRDELRTRGWSMQDGADTYRLVKG